MDGGTYIIVNHHSLLPKRIERARCIDSAPVEFNRASNAVNTAAQHEDTMIVKGDIVGRGIICSLKFQSG